MSAYIPALTDDLPREFESLVKGYFQQSLETGVSGQVRKWQSQDKRYSREFKVTGSLQLDQTRFCRTFLANTKDFDRSRRYEGLACRSKAGEWRLNIVPPMGGLRS